MEYARTLEAIVDTDESPLAHARLSRQLTVDEAARRASVAPEEVQWLEEGRLYRFPSPDRAVTVGRASTVNDLQTAVYYPPGGETVCTHLARQLSVPVQPLPGGDDPRRCVVIVGPQRGPGG